MHERNKTCSLHFSMVICEFPICFSLLTCCLLCLNVLMAVVLHHRTDVSWKPCESWNWRYCLQSGLPDWSSINCENNRIYPYRIYPSSHSSHFHDYGRKTMDPWGLRSISDVFSVRKGLQKSLSWNNVYETLTWPKSKLLRLKTLTCSNGYWWADGKTLTNVTPFKHC